MDRNRANSHAPSRKFNHFAAAALFNSFLHLAALRADDGPWGGSVLLPEAHMHPMLNTAIKAARRGATVINRASFDLDRVTVTEKQHNDFVTDVDQAAEQAIIEVLSKAYPSHAFLAEESGASANTNDENEFVWIIDPLDGTTNFIHGFPQYCVSIALQQRGVTTQAVIYDPVRNDLFTATKGAGAFLNEKRIRVTKLDRIANALLSTGYAPGSNRALEEYLKMYQVMGERCQGLRRPGSAALDLAYVAAGRLDGFYEKGLKPWDIAAGALLITESGGIVGEFSGESDYLHKGDVVAASPKIFAQMVALLAPFA
jgi:myo-inositol-1(or 4)-monophosphatase